MSQRAMMGLIFCASLLSGCASSPPQPPTTPKAATPAPPLRFVAVDEAAARKDLDAAKAQSGYDEVAGLKPVASSQESAHQGRAIFVTSCAPCHGDGGLGDGPAGSALDPKPRNLTKPAEHKYGHLELALFRSAKFGVDGTGMSPWKGRLSDEELWKVVHYVRGLQGD